jgi:hypothetical protein
MVKRFFLPGALDGAMPTTLATPTIPLFHAHPPPPSGSSNAFYLKPPLPPNKPDLGALKHKKQLAAAKKANAAGSGNAAKKRNKLAVLGKLFKPWKWAHRGRSGAQQAGARGLQRSDSKGDKSGNRVYLAGRTRHDKVQL